MAHGDPYAPAMPTEWDDATFDAWSNVARLRFLQRRLAQSITEEAARTRVAVDRHPQCATELEALLQTVHQLADVTSRLLAMAPGGAIAPGDASS